MSGQDARDGHAYALRSTNDGTTWSAAPMPAGWDYASSTSCTAVDACVAIGAEADGALGVAARD